MDTSLQSLARVTVSAEPVSEVIHFPSRKLFVDKKPVAS